MKISVLIPTYSADKAIEVSLLSFFRYNKATAAFGSMSYSTVRKSAFDAIGPDPFIAELRAAEDSYLCYQLALLGPVVLLSSPLVAYQLAEGSLSLNRLRNLGLWVRGFKMQVGREQGNASTALLRTFTAAYAAKRREFSKVLLGTGNATKARQQLLLSLKNCWQPLSLAKSISLIVLSLLSAALQPQWPSSVRQAGVRTLTSDGDGMN